MRRAGPVGGSANLMYESIEDGSEKMVDHLSSKVHALKSLSIEIGEEVKLHNKLLDDLDSGFDNTGSFLSQTMNKLIVVSKKGHHNVICYLLIFCFFVFLVAWFILKFL